MTMENVLEKIALILGKSVDEVKRTPYEMLLHDMVEEFFLYVEEGNFRK